VKDPDNRTLLEGALLRQGCDNGIPESARELIEAWFAISFPSANPQIEPIKPLRPQQEREQDEECKCDLLREWQHESSTRFVIFAALR
jgi:hypothetical protein